MKSANYHNTLFSQLKSNIQWKVYKLKMLAYSSVYNAEWKHMGIISKLLYVPIGATVTAFMKLTIPPFMAETWDRRFASIFPLCGLAFVVLQFQLYEHYFFLVVSFSAAAIFSLVIYLSTHRTTAPKIIIVIIYQNI